MENNIVPWISKTVAAIDFQNDIEFRSIDVQHSVDLDQSNSERQWILSVTAWTSNFMAKHKIDFQGNARKIEDHFRTRSLNLMLFLNMKELLAE
jgi:hypothetical protein